MGQHPPSHRLLHHRLDTGRQLGRVQRRGVASRASGPDPRLWLGGDRNENDALIASRGDGKGLRRRGPGPRSSRATRHPPSRSPQCLHPHDHRDRALHRDHVRGHRGRGDDIWLARTGQLDGRFGAQR